MSEEIEKLKAINNELTKELHEARHTKYERYVVPEIENLKQEIERLHSIIKKVREWILEQQLEEGIEPIINTDKLDEVLEILDKEFGNE